MSTYLRPHCAKCGRYSPALYESPECSHCGHLHDYWTRPRLSDTDQYLST